jgi:hypothetical protein
MLIKNFLSKKIRFQFLSGISILDLKMSNYKIFLQDCDRVSEENSPATEYLDDNEEEQPPLKEKV